MARARQKAFAVLGRQSSPTITTKLDRALIAKRATMVPVAPGRCKTDTTAGISRPETASGRPPWLTLPPPWAA
jgi:hypothetical protein